MELCSDGHQEICFDTPSCPLCKVIMEKIDLETREENARIRISHLEKDVENLKDELESVSS